ncbi:MAG: DUF6600 domain-containing protein [Polyangiaceae bacterium]|jgi:hypothetical protein
MQPKHSFPILAFALGLSHCEAAVQGQASATAASVPPPVAQVDVAASGATTTPPPPDQGDNGSKEYALGVDADSYDDVDPAAVTDFKSNLQPYGSWTDDPSYGTIWTPSHDAVGDDFSPYVSGGHWAYDDDWVWVSSYSWGWAPFHYGRWFWIEGRGWAWVPGRAYRGAWVSWGADDGYGYVGWAPLAPQFFWFGGAAVVRPFAYSPRWSYCARAEVFAPVVATRVLVGPAAIRVGASVRPMVFTGAARVGYGPSPQRLGYSQSEIPRPTGPGAEGVLRARQYARPSTAQALGGSKPAAARSWSPGSSTPRRDEGNPHSPSPASPARSPSAQPRATPVEASRPGPKSAPRPAPTPAPKPQPSQHFTPAHRRK